MKRRTFLQSLGAISAFVASDSGAAFPTLASATCSVLPPTLFYEQVACWGGVLCFGLGPAGERIVDLAHEEGMGSRYRAASDGQERMSLRLERCRSALLAVDTRDPRALMDSLFWAAQLAEHEVDSRVAVLLNADTSLPNHAWRQAMTASLDSLIEVRPFGAGPGTEDTVLSLLSGIPNMQDGLIAFDISDVRAVLATASKAWTTAARWSEESMRFFCF